MFPDFNIHSTPLLFLVLQGLIFGVLLLMKFSKGKFTPHLLLALILLITCWHRTTYTIGFMAWYDTFRNTKVNYYLIPFGLALAPLLYLYVKSITVSNFKFNKKHFYHFIPFIIYFVYRIFLVIYDANQPGYNSTQNGVIMSGFHNHYVEFIYVILTTVQMAIYLSLTIRVYLQYRKKIQQFFSNTYQLELNWLRNFLFIYTFLFVYSFGETIINEFVTPLHWTQKWWYHFLSGLAIVYIGIKGYFTETEKLTDVAFNNFKPLQLYTPKENNYSSDIQKIENYFTNEKPYLNANLSLSQLAEKMGYSSNQLSEIINSGFHKNFNDFINEYRVKAVKLALDDGQHNQKSLVGIAMDCGFNSKPTFNRVFKKLAGTSPTQYIKTQLS